MGKLITDQILGMKWLNTLIGNLLNALGLDTTSRIGGSVQFFLYDVIKITVLLCVLIYLISYIQSYFPPERSKKIMGRFHGIWAHCIAALLGTVTPFCSCSSIPLFIGFTSAGLPLGVTFSFLISSPMVDLGSLVLLMSIFGAKVAVLYVVLGLVIAVAGGTINDVAEGVGVARSTTHRYLQELSDRNLIDYSRGILSAPQSAKMKTAYVSAPLVGSIRCGNPEDEEESIEEYVSLPVSMFGKGDFYILRAKGDSMVDAGIDEDDLLVIERNCPALEGDIVVALDEDNQNTLKRYAGYDKDSGYYILEYENEARYPGKTIKVRSFQVQGVARHVIKSL